MADEKRLQNNVYAILVYVGEKDSRTLKYSTPQRECKISTCKKNSLEYLNEKQTKQKKKRPADFEATPKMATIDMTHRKLNFPPRFLPYLEKHRIFELFHECIELLVQVQPKDHVQFLKKVLPCAAMKKDKQRIVFFSPPGFDRKTFSEFLAECLGIQYVDLELLKFLTRERRLADKILIEEIAESVEEESCICPGEGEGEMPFVPMYYGPAEEEEYILEPKTPILEEEEEECVELQKPCVCVCPCVANDDEKNKGDKDSKSKGDLEGEQGEWEGEEYPCEKHKKRKKGGKTLTTDSSGRFRTSGETSAAEIDFGILSECEFSAKGWILQDFPTTGEEAERLNALGVIPTHAVRIITDEKEETNSREYKWRVHNWINAYNKFIPVTEIRVKDRNITELAKDLCRLLSIMPHRHAPMLPRIVLIGSRGSGVTTQGQKLAQKYRLVHVEFELVIARALQQDDDLSKLYKTQLATRPDPELEALILERALLTPACRNRGWVLTGFPKNIDQMRMLDIIATPPNRVIFLEVPARECFVRLYYRKIDPCLGDEYKLPKIEPCDQDSYQTPGMDPEISNRLLAHPKNDRKQIIYDIEQYFLHKTDMMHYCGKTASYVDGNQTVDTVFEFIEQILINPSPAQPPRDPLAINYGIDESYERLKKFRLASGMYFNNMFLNPPERVERL